MIGAGTMRAGPTFKGESLTLPADGASVTLYVVYPDWSGQ